jgi:uncharacterized membrane protein YvbJ
MSYASELDDPVTMEEDCHNDSDQSSTCGTVSDGDSGTGKSRSSSTMHQNEERAVKKAKYFVGFCVFLCLVAVVLAVYFLTAHSDQRSFDLAVSKNDHSISSGARDSAIVNFFNSSSSQNMLSFFDLS